MAVPEQIPITRYPGRHTDLIGRYADGQFFGCVTGAHARLISTRPDPQFERRQRWYAVLHRFDHDGNHLGSDVWFAGTTADGREAVVDRALDVLRGWLDALPALAYGDVRIKPFRFEADGLTFGLIDESDHHGDHAEFHPNHLAFYPPWNGGYDT